MDTSNIVTLRTDIGDITGTFTYVHGRNHLNLYADSLTVNGVAYRLWVWYSQEEDGTWHESEHDDRRGWRRGYTLSIGRVNPWHRGKYQSEPTDAARQFLKAFVVTIRERLILEFPEAMRQGRIFSAKKEMALLREERDTLTQRLETIDDALYTLAQTVVRLEGENHV